MSGFWLLAARDHDPGRGIECVENSDGACLPAWRVGLFAIGGVIEGVSIGE